MKRFLVLSSVIFLTSASFNVLAENPGDHAKHTLMMQKGMQGGHDERISLGISPKKKQHQLANMRSHLEAIQTIAGLLSKGEFDAASKIAHAKLGLTPEMEKMCNMFENADFKKMGLVFHNSGDDLGDALKTGDMEKSLEALRNTMNHCVQCHKLFRQ